MQHCTTLLVCDIDPRVFGLVGLIAPEPPRDDIPKVLSKRPKVNTLSSLLPRIFAIVHLRGVSLRQDCKLLEKVRLLALSLTSDTLEKRVIIGNTRVLRFEFKRASIGTVVRSDFLVVTNLAC